MHNQGMTTLKKNINLLRCPKTKQSLKLINNKLISLDKQNIYEIEKSRIPIFFEDNSFSNTSIQKDHYNNIYKSYLENLSYPHKMYQFSYQCLFLKNFLKYYGLIYFLNILLNHF